MGKEKKENLRVVSHSGQDSRLLGRYHPPKEDRLCPLCPLHNRPPWAWSPGGAGVEILSGYVVSRRGEPRRSQDGGSSVSARLRLGSDPGDLGSCLLPGTIFSHIGTAAGAVGACQGESTSGGGGGDPEPGTSDSSGAGAQAASEVVSGPDSGQR